MSHKNHKGSKKPKCCVREDFITSNGVRLFFRQYQPVCPKPGAPPLLFIHGFALNSTVWECAQQKFCELGYTSVAFDLPGHGLSDKPVDINQLNGPALLNDITQVITQLGLVRPVIIGHSLGGFLTLAYALQNQSNLTAIVTVGAFPNLVQITPAANAAIGQFLFATPNLHDFAVAFDSAALTETSLPNCPCASALLQTLIAITEQGSLTSYQLILLAALQNPVDLVPLLSNLTLPVLVVQGTIDNAVLPNTGDIIRDAINQGKGGAGTANTANAILTEIRNKGHIPYITDTDYFNRILFDFLNSTDCDLCPLVRPE